MPAPQVAPAPGPPLVVAPQQVQVVPPPAATGPLVKIRSDIQTAITDSTAKAAGVVVDVDGIGRLYQQNSDDMLPPASTQKLQTAGVALLTLGPNYRFRTDVLAKGQLTPEGVLKGDLVLAGGGDPALTKTDLAAMASAVQASGVRTVEGAVWGDESRYDNIRIGPGWKSEFVTEESGPLSALAVDRNEYRKDSGYVADPVPGNVEVFRQAMQAAGVGIAGPTQNGRPEGELSVLTTHYSPPLADIVSVMLKESDNFYAEMVMKELGRTIGKPTTAGGAEVVAAKVRSLGVAPGEVHDGSGLSALNRHSAASELAWLRAIERSSVAETFKSSLAVSCVAPGTLKKRFCGSSAAGQVFGKTGALPGSAVLVGYTTTASGKLVRFAFILAGTDSNRRARAAIDRAVTALRDFQG